MAGPLEISLIAEGYPSLNTSNAMRESLKFKNNFKKNVRLKFHQDLAFLGIRAIYLIALLD